MSVPGLMRIMILFICCFLQVGFTPQQQYPGFKQVANMNSFKQEFALASSKTISVKADFTQEKTLAALTEKITSYGKLWFKRDNKVRLDYEKPFVYQMIIHGDKMSVRDEQKQTQMSTSSNKVFQQVNRIIIDCMQGTILQSKDFQARVFENESAYLLELSPVNKVMKEFLTTIVLTIEKKTNTPVSIRLNEPSGDNTIIKLSNKVLNEHLKDEVFSF